jgi:hypothetical protein
VPIMSALTCGWGVASNLRERNLCGLIVVFSVLCFSEIGLWRSVRECVRACGHGEMTVRYGWNGGTMDDYRVGRVWREQSTTETLHTVSS